MVIKFYSKAVLFLITLFMIVSLIFNHLNIMTTKCIVGATVVLLIADLILLTFEGQVFSVLAFAVLSAIGTITALVVAWVMKWNLPMVAFSCVGSASLLLWSTYLIGGRHATLARIKFEGASFGLEYMPDPSFEGYNNTQFIFFVPKGEKKRKYFSEGKYIQQREKLDGTFSVFPSSPELLEGTECFIIDTVTRDVMGAKPIAVTSTLYIDPGSLSKKSFDTFLKFVNECYKKPDRENPILDWLNNYAGALKLAEGDRKIIRTIYAIVYATIEDIERVYVSPDGKDSLKIQIDGSIKISESLAKRIRKPKDLSFHTNTIGVLRDRIFYYQGIDFETDTTVLLESLNALGDLEHFRCSAKIFGLLYDSAVIGSPEN